MGSPINSDSHEWRDLLDRLRRLENTTMLQNATITEGGLTIISEDPGLVVQGLFDLTGRMRLNGTLPIVLRIVSGQPTIEVGGGYVRGYNDGVVVGRADGGSVTATSAGAALAFGAFGIGATSSGLSVAGLPTVDAGDVHRWIGVDSSGNLVRVDPGTGGPMGSGEFAWPFPLSLVTKEYDPNDPGYTNGHLGIDFGSGIANVAGTPIPAASGGTVIANEFEAERGWHVILNHGTRGGYTLTTRYYHMHVKSPVTVGSTVAKGQTIGGIGTTGLSTGNHLHFETRRNGEAMNPRSFMAIYGE